MQLEKLLHHSRIEHRKEQSLTQQVHFARISAMIT